MPSRNIKKIVLLLVALVSCTCGTLAEPSFFLMRDGHRSDAYIIDVASVATVTHCAKKCTKNAQCNVYNVGPAADGRLTCEIVHSPDYDHAFDMATEQTGWTMYYGTLHGFCYLSILNLNHVLSFIIYYLFEK